MEKVEFLKHGQLTTLRIAKAFLVDGYRVFIDKEHEPSKTWVGDDGESDKIFSTKESAENAIIIYVNKLLDYNFIKNYTVY